MWWESYRRWQNNRSISITIFQLTHKRSWENEAHQRGKNGEEKGFVYWVAESGGTILYTFVLVHPNKTVRTMKEHINVLVLVFRTGCFLKKDWGEGTTLTLRLLLSARCKAHWETTRTLTLYYIQQRKLIITYSGFLLQLPYKTRTESGRETHFLMLYALLTATALMCFNYSTHSYWTAL